MRELDSVELARLHFPSRDWSALTCDRCERAAKVRSCSATPVPSQTALPAAVTAVRRQSACRSAPPVRDRGSRGLGAWVKKEGGRSPLTNRGSWD